MGAMLHSSCFTTNATIFVAVRILAQRVCALAYTWRGTTGTTAMEKYSASTDLAGQGKSELGRSLRSITPKRVGNGLAVVDHSVGNHHAQEAQPTNTGCRAERSGSSVGEKYSKSMLGGSPLVLPSTHMMI